MNIIVYFKLEMINLFQFYTVIVNVHLTLILTKDQIKSETPGPGFSPRTSHNPKKRIHRIRRKIE